MTLEIESPTWSQDQDEAQRRGSSVEAIQTERRIASRVEQLEPKTAVEADKLKEKGLALIAQAEEKEREVSSGAAEWESIIESNEKTERQRKHGEAFARDFEDEIRGCKEQILACLSEEHGQVAYNFRAEGAILLGTRILGAERALAIVPEWREAMDAKRAANDERLIALAKKHGIVSKLPAELQAKAKA